MKSGTSSQTLAQAAALALFLNLGMLQPALCSTAIKVVTIPGRGGTGTASRRLRAAGGSSESAWAAAINPTIDSGGLGVKGTAASTVSSEDLRLRRSCGTKVSSTGSCSQGVAMLALGLQMHDSRLTL